MRKDYERIFQAEREYVAQKLKETEAEWDTEAYEFVLSTIVVSADNVFRCTFYSDKERLTRAQAIFDAYREWSDRYFQRSERD